jgi:hypothetical protein
MPARTVGLLIDVLMPPPSARSAPGTLQLIDSLGVPIGNFEVDGIEGQVSILAWCPEYAVNTNVYLRIEPATTEPEPSDEAAGDSAELLDDSTTSATGTDGATEITEAPTPYEIGITLLFPEEPEIPEPLVEISRPDSPVPSVVRSTPSAAVLVLTGLSATSLTRPTSGGLDLVSSVGHGNTSRSVRQPLSQSLRNPSVVDLTLVEFDSPQTPDAETSPQGEPVPRESSELRTAGGPHRTSDEVRSPGGLPLLAAVLPAPGPELHQSLNLRFVDLNSPDGAPQPGSPAGVAVAPGEATPDPAATPLPQENSEQTGSRTLSTTLGLSLASLLALGLLWPDFISGLPGRNVLKRGMLARWCRRLLNGSGRGFGPRGFGPFGSRSLRAD